MIGKTSQINDFSSKKLITNLEQLRKLECDDTIQITNFRMINESNCMVTYKTKEDCITPFTGGNLFVASQITARCRVHLMRTCTLLEEHGYGNLMRFVSFSTH